MSGFVQVVKERTRGIVWQPESKSETIYERHDIHPGCYLRVHQRELEETPRRPLRSIDLARAQISGPGIHRDSVAGVVRANDERP